MQVEDPGGPSSPGSTKKPIKIPFSSTIERRGASSKTGKEEKL
jgi:hypothetical protein